MWKLPDHSLRFVFISILVVFCVHCFCFQCSVSIKMKCNLNAVKQLICVKQWRLFVPTSNIFSLRFGGVCFGISKKSKQKAGIVFDAKPLEKCSNVADLCLWRPCLLFISFLPPAPKKVFKFKFIAFGDGRQALVQGLDKIQCFKHTRSWNWGRIF